MARTGSGRRTGQPRSISATARVADSPAAARMLAGNGLDNREPDYLDVYITYGIYFEISVLFYLYVYFHLHLFVNLP